MDRDTLIYVLWGAWVTANVVTYLFIKEEWEIMPPEKGRDVFNIPWGRVQWLCAVTHNTIIMYLIALWRERNER